LGPEVLLQTLCVTKKLFDTICDVGHPHEMIFIEPTHIFFDEMIGDLNNLAISLSAPSQGYSTMEEEEACRL
jgi:hypothetical protein